MNEETEAFLQEFKEISFRLRGIIEIYFPRQFWEVKEKTKRLAESLK